MPRFAANLSMLFTEAPLLERFERAARAGFRAVEMQFPYEASAAAIQERLAANGLAMVLHNFPAGDWAAGDRGLACNPHRQAEFRAGVAKAIEYAAALGVPQLNCLAGKPGAGVDEATTRRTFVDNVRYAAEQCAKAGLRVLMEPINNFDVPGFWLNRTAKALEVVAEVGLPNVAVQYDIYHAQRYEGELAATMQQHLAKIGHIQFADNPGRNEPGTGELNFAFLFAHIDRIGYSGWLGAEYKPATTTEAGLGWLRQFSS
ncbi:MAG: hydroxypyruvate isomerase [Betaproteobacteria bacterium]|nr:hydroxypyruvate isomerase [Betaproteobacteria bacterium]